MAGQGYLLDDGFVRKLQRMLQWFEHTPHNCLPPRPPGPQILHGTVIGKLDGALSQGGSATVSVWTGEAGSEADSDSDITAYDWLMKIGADDIASGKKVVCTLINGEWYVTEAECP